MPGEKVPKGSVVSKDFEDRLNPGDFQELINRANDGDGDSIRKLRKLGKGRFSGKPMEDVPPMFRSAYASPLLHEDHFDDLRAAREYSVEVVDEFVNKVCDTKWLPPGAAMLLFCYMCTKHASTMSSFTGALRMKMMQMFKVWDESHPQVKADIMFRLRDRLYLEHHLTFCEFFENKAKEYEKIVEEERKEVTDDESGDCSHD